MDFILPNDDTMEIMREEFAKLKINENARAFALADEESVPENISADADADANIDTHADAPSFNTPAAGSLGAYISSALLLLYFVKHLGYNMNYGTQIFNTDRGLEQLQCVRNSFGQLNNLG